MSGINNRQSVYKTGRLAANPIPRSVLGPEAPHPMRPLANGSPNRILRCWSSHKLRPVTIFATVWNTPIATCRFPKKDGTH